MNFTPLSCVMVYSSFFTLFQPFKNVNGVRVSVLQDEEVLEDWLHNNVTISNSTELYT